MEVSKHCEEGALKYGEHNVDKGIPLHSLLQLVEAFVWTFGDSNSILLSSLLLLLLFADMPFIWMRPIC